MRKIKDLSANDQAIIIGLKPFREANRELFALHEADRSRKHTRLCATSARQLFGMLGGGGVGVAGGANVTLAHMIMNGVFVEKLTYGAAESMATTGEAQMFATGVPAALPVSLQFVVSYREPEDLRGSDVVASVRGWCKLVSSIIAKFD